MNSILFKRKKTQLIIALELKARKKHKKKKYLNFNHPNLNLCVQTLSSKQGKEKNDGDVEQQMGGDGGHVDSV